MNLDNKDCNVKNERKVKNKTQQGAANSRGRFPFVITLKSLVLYILTVIVVGLYLFFIRGDTAGKICAFIVCPTLIIYFVYAYRKEKKADKNAWKRNNHIMDDSYFESPEWHDEYIRYIYEYPFERTKYSNMKLDLLMRFQRKEYMVGMLLMSFLMACSACCIPMGKYAMFVIGICLFGFLFYLQFALFIGMPVRKWLKGDIDLMHLKNHI